MGFFIQLHGLHGWEREEEILKAELYIREIREIRGSILLIAAGCAVFICGFHCFSRRPDPVKPPRAARLQRFAETARPVGERIGLPGIRPRLPGLDKN